MKQTLFIVLLAFGCLNAVHAEPGGEEEGGGRPPVSEQNQGQQSQGQGPRRGGSPHRPPPEALAACKGKASGTTCSFTTPSGKSINGSCWAPDESKPLGCKPSSPVPMR